MTMTQGFIGKRLSWAVVGMVAVLVAGVTPASAANSGSAKGAGVYQFESNATSASTPTAPCGAFTSMSYLGAYAGRITVTNGPSYTGPMTLTMNAGSNTPGTTAAWNANPTAIYHHTDIDCNDTPVNLSVAATLSATGFISCPSLTGSNFARTGTTATVTLSGQCSVTPLNGGTPQLATVTLAHTGTVAPCVRDKISGGQFPIAPPTKCVSPDASFSVS